MDTENIAQVWYGHQFLYQIFTPMSQFPYTVYFGLEAGWLGYIQLASLLQFYRVHSLNRKTSNSGLGNCACYKLSE